MSPVLAFIAGATVTLILLLIVAAYFTCRALRAAQATEDALNERTFGDQPALPSEIDPSHAPENVT
jgi:hypothetical protein